MKRLNKIAVFIFLGLFLWSARSFADVPKTISFQGRLTDNAGAPISASNQNFTFRFYRETEGSPSFSKTVSGVNISNGLYSITLPFSDDTELNSLNNPLYVQVEYGGETIGNRVALTASPYALSVRDNAITAAKIVNGAVTGDKLEVVSGLPSFAQGESNNKQLSAGGKFKVLNATVDDKGRVIALSEKEMTMPSGLPPSGTAGGDLTGTYPNPSLRTIPGLPSVAQGEPDNKTLTSGGTFQVLQATVDNNGRVKALASRTMTMPVITSTAGFELTANKETSSLSNNSSAYPASSVIVSTLNALRTIVNGKVNANISITSGTYTKISFDSKGLVTSGAYLSEGDIPSLSAYVTIASTQIITGRKTFNNGITIDTNSNLTIGSAVLKYGYIAGSINTDGLIIESTMNIKGSVNVGGTVSYGNADLAEIYPSAELLNPGDVVIISESRDGYIEKSKTANDSKAAGVVSVSPGIVLNSEATGYKLALVGKVPVNITNEGGSVKRGDLLVTSSSYGYAMKAPENPKPGTIIGKALENFTGSRGKILALVNLQ